MLLAQLNRLTVSDFRFCTPVFSSIGFCLRFHGDEILNCSSLWLSLATEIAVNIVLDFACFDLVLKWAKNFVISSCSIPIFSFIFHIGVYC